MQNIFNESFEWHKNAHLSNDSDSVEQLAADLAGETIEGGISIFHEASFRVCHNKKSRPVKIKGGFAGFQITGSAVVICAYE